MFKNVSKDCTKNEIYIRKNTLLNNFSCKSKTKFLKEVCKVGSNEQSKSQCIDGRSKPKYTIFIFEEKFKKFLSDSGFQTVGPDTSREHRYVRNRFCFSLEDVYTAISLGLLQV